MEPQIGLLEVLLVLLAMAVPLSPWWVRNGDVRDSALKDKPKERPRRGNDTDG